MTGRSLAALTVIMTACFTSHADAASFHGPFGVAVNSNDVIYVAEINNKRITKLDTDGNVLGHITTIEGYGQLAGPFDVCIGPEDRIYITDCFAHRIVVLDRNEQLLFALGSGIKGSEPGEFSQPHFMTVNAAGELFVADTFNARIQKFSPDGKFITAWGRVGNAPGEYSHHGYLARIDVDGQGFVYVREFDGGRIQKYTENGEYIATFASRGTQPGQLDEGYGLSVIDGKLYCPDTFESRVQVFSLDGQLLENWDPGEGNAGPHFNHPVDIAETSTGELIVTDWKNDRVVKLNKQGEFLATWGRSMEDILEWQPPDWHPRPARGPIEISFYSGGPPGDVQLAHDYGMDNIYCSTNHQDGDWPLIGTVELADQLGITVKPSIACFVFGHHSMQFINQHPELTIWKKGATEPMSTILSWAHPEARSYRADHMVAQVKRTGVHGIMLDYIRYLGTDYGYDPVIVNGFFQRYGINPLDLPQDDQRWMQYRADFVTQFIVELRHKLAVEIPDRHIEISVYLSGDDPTPGVYLTGSLQDWRTWANMGIVDKLNVAHYTRDLDRIYDAVRRVREAVPDRVLINSFIACYGGNLNTPELLRKGFEASIAGGADEVTVYRSDAIAELNLHPVIAEISADIRAGRLAPR
jgi:DNA-binding beta-propeller fold protein YncE